MNPERFLELVTAHGIDLQYFAAQMPPKEAKPVASAATRERHRRYWGLQAMQEPPGGRAGEALASWVSARGRSDKTPAQGQWSVADFARACAGMPAIHWTLLCFTVFPREEDRIKLKARLMLVAADESARQRWPRTIRRSPCADCHRATRGQYLEDLCTLALHEWAQPDAFKTQEQLARWFGVSRGFWSLAMAPKFRPMQSRLAHWWGHGLGHIWLGLRRMTPGPSEACGKSVS